MSKSFTVRRYFSTFCELQIKAKDDNEAYQKSKDMSIPEDEIMLNLEEWTDCDEVEEDEVEEDDQEANN